MHVFEIMAEPIRRRIVEILASGEHPVFWIADSIRTEFGVTRTATSWHLAILLENGWVDVRREWSNRMYRLNFEAFDELDEEVHHLRQLWERRTGTIERHDPQLWHVLPIIARSHDRSSFASMRGRRGKGRRTDIWVTGPHTPEIKLDK